MNSTGRKEEAAATRYYRALKAGKISEEAIAANRARIAADIAEGRLLREADEAARLAAIAAKK